MQNMLKKMKDEGWFPFLQTGVFIDSNGRSVTFKDSDLEHIESSYSRNSKNFKEAPLVVGHPKDDSPAYGWVEKVKKVGDFIFAKPSGVANEFKEAIQKTMYKYVSPSIRPDMTLKHIGFLGGTPPAIPGLGSVTDAFKNFSEEDLSIFEFEFAELDAWGVERIFSGFKNHLRNLREFFIETFSLAVADRIIPEYEINEISTVIKKEKEPVTLSEQKNKKNKEESMGKNVPDKAGENQSTDFSERLVSETKRADEAVKELKEYKEKQAEKKISNFVEGLKKSGKVLPKEEKSLVGFLKKLDENEAMEFAEGEEKKSSRDFMMNFLEGLPARIPLENLPGKDKDESRIRIFRKLTLMKKNLNFIEKQRHCKKKKGSHMKMLFVECKGRKICQNYQIKE